MRTHQLIAVLFVAASIVAWAFASTASAAPAPAAAPALRGGGAVIHLQKQLLEALDRADFRAAAERFGGRRDPVLVTGSSVHGGDRAQGKAAVQRALAAWYADAAGSVESRIVDQRVECGSEDLSFGVFRVERKSTRDGEARTERFDVTTLVSLRGAGGIFHMHVSRAGDEPAR